MHNVCLNHYPSSFFELKKIKKIMGMDNDFNKRNRKKIITHFGNAVLITWSNDPLSW